MASVSDEAIISKTAKIWEHAQIREKAVVGNNTIIGRGAYVGVGVKVAENCKIQNYALLYEPAHIEKGVLIGPGVILTNDKNPRAVNPDFSQKLSNDWTPVGVVVEEGASIGAQSVCVAPLKIGRWSLIAAGSTVVKDVPSYALVAGSPATQIGWVGKSGHRLIKVNNKENTFICPSTKEIYVLANGSILEEEQIQ